MKKLSMVLAGLALIAAGCASTKSDAAAGAVSGEKKACCKDGAAATCTDAEKAKAASPGMVGEKKSCGGGGCSAGSAGCTAGQVKN